MSITNLNYLYSYMSYEPGGYLLHSNLFSISFLALSYQNF